MSPNDSAAEHVASIRAMSRAGQALGLDSPHATIRNPEWFNGREVTPARQELHERLLAEYRAQYPDAVQDRQAIVLAGPPGAGKSSSLHAVVKDEGHWLRIDADNFKVALLEQAIADGSYDSFIKPAEFAQREVVGEPCFPMEAASLVHHESSRLAQRLQRQAIDEGTNIIIDTVLSNPDEAEALGQRLAAAGYSVQVVDVEVTFQTSEARIRDRWERGYANAINEGGLGGRWVPSEYARSVFNGIDGRSNPEIAADRLAETCDVVTDHYTFRNDVNGQPPELIRHRHRDQDGAAFREAMTVPSVNRAATSTDA